MNIGLLEICSANHYSLVESWAHLLHLKGHQVTIYTNNRVRKMIELPFAVDWQLKGDHESPHRFLKRVTHHTIKHIDSLIIVSIQDHHEFFLIFRPKVPTYITIHNAKTWFVKWEFSFRNAFKTLVRRLWLRRAKAYFVNSRNMRDYVLQNSSLKKPLYIMPFNLCLSAPSVITARANKKVNELTIAVPGIVSVRRKDYNDILAVAERLCNEIRVILLGAPNAQEGGNEILARAEDLRAKGCKIDYYQKYLSHAEFEERLNGSDFVLGSLVAEFRNPWGFVEEYGRSKDSGVSYAMIRHAIPGIFHIKTPNLIDLESSTLYYSSADDLEKTCRFLLANPQEVITLRENAQINALKFTPQKISESFDFL